ncbi:MAG: class I mannose-6-phosphate isomerase [Chloroflexota bacterium]
MTPALYPLLLRPALHVKVWGGRRLEERLGKRLPTDEPYGESWELHDTATVANGPLAGRTLGELASLYGEDLLGAGNDPAAGFPLLAKFLDAREWLSVQVHPNDEQARSFGDGPRGKTEAWYVIDADPGAQLVIGVQPGTTREAIADAIRANRLEDLLVYAPVKAGDTLFVAAGTVHALGPGVLIYEIQQSSDITYRFYDWGRMGLDGKPRELHIDKSLAVANTESLPQINHSAEIPGERVRLFDNPFFVTDLLRLDNELAISFGDDNPRTGFDALTCIDGSVTISSAAGSIDLTIGQTALVPPVAGKFTVSGQGRVLRSAQVTA